MGYELKKLMNMYGVSTPTMAPAPQMPGAAPTAVAELVKPELRAQPVAPVKPGRKASAEEKAAYQAARSTYNADLKAWNADKKTYDAAMKTYNTALPKYQEDLAKYEKDKAAFDETMRKYGLDKAQYDQYAQDYQNRLANTNLYNQAQFSTTGANVPPITTFSDAQKAAVGMMPATDQVGGPQDFANIGQGGLNQQIQSYMSTSPSAPDMNAFMTRYGLTDYDMRNAMGTGTTYGAPQWTDVLKPPVYASSVSTPPTVGTVNTGTGNVTGAVGPTDTSGALTNVANVASGRDRDRDQPVSRPSTGTGTGSFGLPDPFGGGSRTTFGGYTGLRDMFDGGGPGRSGTRGGYTGLRDMFDGGGPGRSRAKAAGGYIQNYAEGGTVRGYAPGGIISGGAGNDVLMGRPAGDMLTPAPAPVVEDPQDAMMAMLERYAAPVDRSAEIAAAAERRAAEQKAFEELLMGQVDTQDMAPESKAEMYLRLAAAFGAPTKTGHFSENLALAGQTMADQLAEKSKREREARERKLGVQTELQKMRLEAAGEEESRLLGLQEDEAKYGRELARDLIKDYINSGKPQTEAAKMASDMGLKPGTPEFNAKVVEIVELDIAEKKSLIDARLAMRDNVPAAFAALDAQARAAGFLPESEGGDGSYEEFMATRGSGFAAEARVIGTARGEATAAAPVDVATADKTLEYIEEIRNHPGKSIGTGGSSYLNVIRGTPGYGFQKRVDQLTSGAFLTAIEQLRGMGALSNAEGQTAKEAVTRMDTSTSEEEFDAALSDYESVVKGAQERARARLQEPTAGTGADLGLSDEDLLNMYGN